MLFLSGFLFTSFFFKGVGSKLLSSSLINSFIDIAFSTTILALSLASNSYNASVIVLRTVPVLTYYLSKYDTSERLRLLSALASSTNLKYSLYIFWAELNVANLPLIWNVLISLSSWFLYL